MNLEQGSGIYNVVLGDESFKTSVLYIFKCGRTRPGDAFYSSRHQLHDDTSVPINYQTSNDDPAVGLQHMDLGISG